MISKHRLHCNSGGSGLRSACKGVKDSLFFWEPRIYSYARVSPQSPGWVKQSKRKRFRKQEKSGQKNKGGQKSDSPSVKTKLLIYEMRRCKETGWNAPDVSNCKENCAGRKKPWKR
jgi:hypothetical protein